MNDLLASLFVTAVKLSAFQRFVLMWPLCLSIAVIYKTTRCDRLRQVPASAAVLSITIIAGMYAVGVGLWVLFRIAV